VKFRIGPGVAPLAASTPCGVFGCVGFRPTVVVEAIDWAVKHGMQIISMSLGADFGPEDTADAEASEHAAEAGLIVVAAAGNAGQSVYFLGSPAAGDKTLAPRRWIRRRLPRRDADTEHGHEADGAKNNNRRGRCPAARCRSSCFRIRRRPERRECPSAANETQYDPAKITGKLVVPSAASAPGSIAPSSASGTEPRRGADQQRPTFGRVSRVTSSIRPRQHRHHPA